MYKLIANGALFLWSTLTALMLTSVPAFSQIDAHYKDVVVDEINVTGTGYYGRLLTAGNFNKDDINESIYLKMSQGYLDYVFNENRWARRQDKAYHNKGLKLSKTPDWSFSFVTAFLSPNNSVGAAWQVTFKGEESCVHPSQIIPAHLNKDAYLDFVIPCHGYDAIPYPGEHSLVVLSDGENNYNVRRFTKRPSFYHDGATADFDGDGNLDILLVDAKKLRVFLNDGDGNFTSSDKYFPQFASWKGVYSVEILDVNEDGYFDVFVAGHEEDKYGRQPTMFLLGNKRNKFSSKQKIMIPPVQGYGIVMDVIKEGKNLFVLRTGSGDRTYQGAVVQHVAIGSLKTLEILENKETSHVDRIFRKSDDFGRLKFGGLTNKETDIDFIFDEERVQPVK